MKPKPFKVGDIVYLKGTKEGKDSGRVFDIFFKGVGRYKGQKCRITSRYDDWEKYSDDGYEYFLDKKDGRFFRQDLSATPIYKFNIAEVGDIVMRTKEGVKILSDWIDNAEVVKINDYHVWTKTSKGLDAWFHIDHFKNGNVYVKKKSRLDIEVDLQQEKQMEVRKMEKPKTKLEKDALEKAKKDVIAKAIEEKAKTYEQKMRDYITNEKYARDYRERADKLAKELGITEKDKKNLF